MADRIRIRTYNVRFGDAILVTVPDQHPTTKKTKIRNILIDVGNALNKEGGDDSVFQAVVEDIIQQLSGQPLDLYVMTHEHLDHVQGLYYAATKGYMEGELKAKLNVDYAWLTASSAPDYYDTHQTAQKQKKLHLECYQQIANHLPLLPEEEVKALKSLLDINNPRSTDECVEFLRSLAAPGKTFYVHRGVDVAGKHPFQEAVFEILAPEEDTSAYYRGLAPMALVQDSTGEVATQAGLNQPPPGVDAGAFYDLMEWRRSGFVDNILAIDKAANNTSVVFSLEWRNKRLLFSGDAELASWKMMHQQGLLKPVDYLKVSHHGSHNGTPDNEILDTFLAKSRTAQKCAGISVWDNTYNGIPHEPTNERLRQRCKLKSTLDSRDELYFDIEIPA